MKFLLIFLNLLLMTHFLNAASINRSGTGCPDNLCVWFTGNFSKTSQVHIYKFMSSRTAMEIYMPGEFNFEDKKSYQVISLKLSSAEEIIEFVNEGLYFKIKDGVEETEKFFLKRKEPLKIQLPANRSINRFEKGGSNYTFYDLGKYLSDEKLWGHPEDGVKMVIPRFHENPDLVTKQLEAIRESGQEKISLVLWYVNYPQAENGVHMHTIDISNGLQHQHQENLKNILGIIKNLKFKTVVLRFGPQGKESFGDWKKWDETNYQVQWEAIKEAILLFETELLGSNIEVFYDLSGEGGGLDNPVARQFTRRLWTDYLKIFDRKKSYGFSMAWYPGRLNKLIEDFDKVGVRPPAYAIDVYNSKTISGDLLRALIELMENGEESKPVIIQETYLNDPEVFISIKRARCEWGMNIVSLYQWNLTREGERKGVKHFSDPDASQFDNYNKVMNCD